MAPFRLASLLALMTCMAIQPARADYQICNRTSYVLDAALGIETGGATATQGWFRIVPGGCTTVLSGTWTGERYFLHTRTPEFYGEAPDALNVSRMFCIRAGDFLVAGAERCEDEAGELAPFSEVQPDHEQPTTTTELTDTNDWSLDQARRAALQRLLTLAGYDPGPIDGGDATRTTGALARFLREQSIGDDVLAGTRIFDVLMKAAEAKARETGVTLCNGSTYRVLAALALPDGGGAVTARGWYDLAAGRCQHVMRAPLEIAHLFAFAEAVDHDGKPLLRDGKPLVWGGEQPWCTKNFRFEIAEHGNCAANGHDETRFRRIEVAASKGVTVQLGDDW